MALLVDVFGFLTVVLHGLTLAAQTVALGSVLFLVLLARPLAWLLGGEGTQIRRTAGHMAAFAALALALCEAGGVALQGAVLASTLGIDPAALQSAVFVQAAGSKIGAALLLALLLAIGRTPGVLLLAVGAVELAAAVAVTHAAARMEGREILIGLTLLHQFGAALWIGGMPAFLMALARVHDGVSTHLIGARFSAMSMAGVACLLFSGAGLTLFYVLGPDLDPQGLYGTAYGVMVAAKMALFAALLLLGFGNFLLLRRLRARPNTPVRRLRRFAEVELGIGLTVLFAAASLTSVPPAVDLAHDRVTWAEIAARNTPEWPRLTSPAVDSLYVPATQAKLDAEAAARAGKPSVAYVPGGGVLSQRNAADIAWAEYNHHAAGLFVAAIGLLALLAQAGVRPARHWPLLFLGLGGFILLRADPNVWPLGPLGVWESLRDPEVLQHRFFGLLTVLFALFEWQVRTGWGHRGAALVFPLACAVGSAALLTHAHALGNVKEQLLIELTHTPLALFGLAAGWARWLELRLDWPERRRAGWVWPVCLLLCGLLLLDYRET
jgi:putative copper resistance protein D